MVHKSKQTQMTIPVPAGTNTNLQCTYSFNKCQFSKGRCTANQSVSKTTVVNKYGICRGMCTAVPSQYEKKEEWAMREEGS